MLMSNANNEKLIHPARRIKFDELLEHLTENIHNNTVAESQSGPLSIFHYTNKCQYEALWNEWNMIARGLILDRDAKNVVATPFSKFFNYGENGYSIPQESFDAFEKLDGSLGICFYHDGRWQITTKGAFGQTQALWAQERLKSLSTEALIPGNTYLFEIVYRENKIVVKYQFEELVLLAGYHETGLEMERIELEEIAKQLGVPIANSFSFDSIEKILFAAEQLDHNAEGFVVRFHSGYRIKVKGAVYCRIHKLITHITPIGIWEVLEAKDDIEAIRREIPEEYRDDFDLIKTLLGKRLQELIAEIDEWYVKYQHTSDKELGLILQSLPEVVRTFLFARRKYGKAWIDHTRTRQTIFKRLRPVANILPGYNPSRSMLKLNDGTLFS